MRADMITPYVARRHGDEAVRYALPELEPVLAETFGVIVYHEQVMGVLSALTGCDASEADLLRRRLGDADGQRIVRRLVQERSRESGLDRDAVDAVGRTGTFRRSSDSGHAIAVHFCPDCGSTVFGEPARTPDAVAVAVGCFGDPSFTAPTRAVWDERRHPWVTPLV